MERRQRRRTRSSRVDRRRTRVGQMGYLQDSQSEEEEEEQQQRLPRKRPALCIVSDSDSGSTSEAASPVRRVRREKRSRCISEESQCEEEGEEEQDRDGNRRKERHQRLLELSLRRRKHTTKCEEVQSEEDEECSNVQLIHSSDADDDDSMKDFIVCDEEESNIEQDHQNGSFLSHHLPHMAVGSQEEHFQVVVKALLINALDQTFLKSLYDGVRQKRYAREMQDSLYFLDQRCVLPRLENLKQRSRWSLRYKERVECYPDLQVRMTGGRDQPCEACELHRCTRFHVRLSGQLYDSITLQQDTFMSEDTQSFKVGKVCASRTEVYHQLKHFKYHLSQQCRLLLEEEEEGQQDKEPVKETVCRVFTQLNEQGWVSEQYKKLEMFLNEADFFQDEKLD